MKFKNSDGMLRHVHGLPKVNPEFTLGMPPSVNESNLILDRPESVFKAECDLHPWTTAYVAVLTHPYFAVTGSDGKFGIGNLPDGEYEIEAWHERLRTMRQKIAVRNATATADFSFNGR